MSKTASFPRVLFLMALLSLAAVAQTPASNWESLKALSPGTEVRVASTSSTPGSSKPMLGALESVTDSQLVITLIGMGAGTALGVGIG